MPHGGLRCPLFAVRSSRFALRGLFHFPFPISHFPFATPRHRPSVQSGMRELLYDLRDTWRGLRRDRMYAGAVTGTLALTLGAAIAVYSIVNGVLLRPLAYPEPDHLVSMRE